MSLKKFFIVFTFALTLVLSLMNGRPWPKAPVVLIVICFYGSKPMLVPAPPPTANRLAVGPINRETAIMPRKGMLPFSPFTKQT